MEKPGLRFKLILLFAGVLISTLIIQIFFVIPYIYDKDIQKIQLLQEEIASNIAREIDTDMLQTLSRAKELSERDAFQRMDLSAIQKNIEIIDEGSFRFELLSVLNSEGMFVCGTMENL